MSAEQQPVAWEAVNKYGIIELFLDDDNAKEWAEQEGKVMPLFYRHGDFTFLLRKFEKLEEQLIATFARSEETSLQLIAASERIVRLEEALEWALGAYVDVCQTNTSESWDAEEEQDVIDARRLLSGAEP